MGILASIFPTKYVVIGAAVMIACLSVFSGYLYFTKALSDANNKTLQVELNEANKRVETQKTTIALLQKDAKIQADLMAKYQVSVTDIRKLAADSLIEIANTDYVAEAKSNAPELEKALNARTKALFDSIQKLSQGN